jgi:hypothetical protein
VAEVFAGVAAARTLLSAAELVGSVARASAGWAGAGGTAVQAEALGRRAATLADEGGAAFRTAVEQPSAETLDRSVEGPLRLVELAADAALLAEQAAAECDAAYRADAVAAAVLAGAAARVARELVAVNLAVRPGDARLTRADELAERARVAARRALDSGG